MVNLPEEVVEEILSWLPVKSLVRFKCVCKSWLALFANPNFVAKHIINHQSRDILFFHLYCQEKGNLFYLFEEFEDGLCCIQDFTFNLDDPFGIDDDFIQRLRLVGHCNGLVALIDFDQEVILWNPVLRECRYLPDSCFDDQYVCPDKSYENFHYETCAVGFGYVPETNDYKVVRVVGFWSDVVNDERLPYRAEVFSRTNSKWGEVNFANIGVHLWAAHMWSNIHMEQFFDGVYYWQGRDFITDELVLVAFDMADEVFSQAPFPSCHKFDNTNSNEHKHVVTNIGVFKNESIAVFVSTTRQPETCIDVWVMKEFGVEESWVKQVTIGPLRGLERPLVFWKNDKELIQEDVKGRLVYYDLATMQPDEFSIRDIVGAPDCWSAITYKKTLVSVAAEEDIAAP